jgi:hypothetical protein
MLVYVLMLLRNMSAVLIAHCMLMLILLLELTYSYVAGVSVSCSSDKGSRLDRYRHNSVMRMFLYRHAHPHIVIYT